jgi:hypothetical protein
VNAITAKRKEPGEVVESILIILHKEDLNRSLKRAFDRRWSW